MSSKNPNEVMETNDNYKNLVVRWRENSSLLFYLNLKFGDKYPTFTFLQILQALKHVIIEENLYDPCNTSIIICNQQLENALDRKAFHVAQLRQIIFPHLVNSAEITFPEMVQTKTTLVERRRFFGSLETKFTLQPDFLKVIRTASGPLCTKTIFSVRDILIAFSKYIKLNQQQFLDHRNIQVAIVSDNLLAKAFKLSAFHKCQTRTLIDSQLVCISLKQEAAWKVIKCLRAPNLIENLEIPIELKNILKEMAQQ